MSSLIAIANLIDSINLVHRHRHRFGRGWGARDLRVFHALCEAARLVRTSVAPIASTSVETRVRAFRRWFIEDANQTTLAMSADASFDGGEWSEPAHARAQAKRVAAMLARLHLSHELLTEYLNCAMRVEALYTPFYAAPPAAEVSCEVSSLLDSLNHPHDPS